jgi:hypothetical protein
MKLDTNNKLPNQLYDEWDGFKFSIVNFPCLCSNNPFSPAYNVYKYLSADSVIQELVRHTIHFRFEAVH